MKYISEYLNKFKKISPPDGVVRSEASRIIYEKAGVEVPLESIQVHRDTIYIREKHLIRSEVFLRRSEILSSLAELFPDKKIKDIR